MATRDLIANGICDALTDFCVEIDRLPITPELVRRALREHASASA